MEKHLQNFRAALIAQHSEALARPLWLHAHLKVFRTALQGEGENVKSVGQQASTSISFCASSPSSSSMAFDCVFNLICKLKCAVIVHSVHCTLVLVVAMSP